MGHQVIRQPDGRLAVWSTVSDDFVMCDATAEEIAEHYAQREAECARGEWMLACSRALETGSSSRFNPMSWEEAQAHRAEVHGRPFDPERDTEGWVTAEESG